MKEKKEGNEQSEKPQKQRAPTFLAVCALWQISYSKLFELFQQISPALPRSVPWVMAELDPGEVALHTADHSLKCSVQTWPGLLGTTQNYKIDEEFSQGFLLVTVAVSSCFKASWRCSNHCLRGSGSLALGWICLECAERETASVITPFTQ